MPLKIEEVTSSHNEKITPQDLRLKLIRETVRENN